MLVQTMARSPIRIVVCKGHKDMTTDSKEKEWEVTLLKTQWVSLLHLKDSPQVLHSKCRDKLTNKKQTINISSIVNSKPNFTSKCNTSSMQQDRWMDSKCSTSSQMECMDRCSQDPQVCLLLTTLDSMLHTSNLSRCSSHSMEINDE